MLAGVGSVILDDVTTQKPNWGRVRLGALSLGLSALLLTAFPLVRPFFPGCSSLVVLAQAISTAILALVSRYRVNLLFPGPTLGA